MESRGQKVIYNFFANVVVQIVSLLSGFILPRLILSNFGSDYNGITASITQFISVIALLRAGVGGATRASLYKSFSKKDYKQVSATIRATEQFMRKVAWIFAGVIVVFALVYPYFVRNEFDYWFSATLVFIISISTFIQYFWGITYQMLLQADQKQYVYSILEVITIVLNVFLSVVLIRLGCGIRIVKMGSAIAFCITPVGLNIYAKWHYPLIHNIEPDHSSISQRWDAFFHNMAAFIHSNTDILVLTIFTNTREISVYTVYCLVANGLRKCIVMISTGIEAAFGSMIAKNEDCVLQSNVRLYEAFVHLISSFIFGVGIVLVTPFVGVYTAGIADVNYIRPTFGCLLIFTEMLFSLRVPYDAVISAAGHFKQTKKYAFMEALINLGVSLILVYNFGLIGVIIGTLVATVVRSVANSVYASRHILSQGCWIIVKRYFVTLLSIVLISCSKFAFDLNVSSYGEWIVAAIKVSLLNIVIVTAVNCIFYYKTMKELILKMKSLMFSSLHYR